MRVPVVAFAIDGTPEVVINDETGYTVPLGAGDAFSERLVELAADADRRKSFGAEGRRHCLDRFDWRRMVTALEGLYDRLLAR